MRRKRKKLKLIILFIIFGSFFALVSFAKADTLEQQETFYVDSGYDAEGRSEITATLKSVGSYVYFYVEDGYWSKLSNSQRNQFRSRLNDLASEFDNVVYPKERAVFGSEWTPGIDNDIRITILVSELVSDAGGYIRTYDEYPKSQVTITNEREMFYINALFIYEERVKAFIAHEFQHLISFYQKTKLYGIDEEIWLNEARSEYAPTICGYDDVYQGSNLSARVDLFIESPSDSLTEWEGKLHDYGSVSMFLRYLVNHFGEEILTSMMMNNKIGISSINQALLDLGYSKDFEDVYANWVLANFLNDCNIGFNSKFCYLGDQLNSQRLKVGLTSSYSGFPNLSVTRSSAIKDYSPVWYRFRAEPNASLSSGKDDLKLEFDGQQERGDFIIPYIIMGEMPTETGIMSLTQQQGEIIIPNFISENKILVIAPFNTYKKANFHSNEPSTAFSFTAYSLEKENQLSLNSLSPASGSVSGGTKITLSGNGFVVGAKVKFGSLEATSVSVISSEKIEAIAPAHAVGKVMVTVILPDQSTVSIDGFTYSSQTTLYPNGSLLRSKDGYKVYVIEGPYKRWMQHQDIFNMYGHLRWSDIIDVEPEVLDQYQEAWLIRAAGDPRVFEVNADGTKHWLNMTAAQFSTSGRKWNMVFIVNSFERDFYKTGANVYFSG